MKHIDVCIIGLGPWGLCLLERFISRARRAPEGVKLRIHAVEPRDPGPGVHDKNLPDYLLLNTKCGHVSMFVEDHFSDIPDPAYGPTLLEWAKKEGYGLEEDGFTLTRTGGREITPDDFIARHLLGNYLNWFHGELLKKLPDNVEYIAHRMRAVDVKPSGSREIVVLADGMSFFAHHVFLTTGHTPNVSGGNGGAFPELAGSERVIHVDYPIEKYLSRIGANENVAISGFGLVAIDVMATLTLGRGGRFVSDPSSGKKTYIPSGKEPRIYMFSRSGLPYFARPGTSKDSSLRYIPSFFLASRIDEIRLQKKNASGDSRLDFVQEVLPLLWDEMRLVYYQTKARFADGEAAAERIVAALREARSNGSFNDYVERLGKEYGRFAPEEIFFLDLRGDLRDSEDYESRLLAIMHEDLCESAKGEVGSARKAAFELFRELRDTIRYAVDFGGLTPASHQQFVKRIAPLISRVIVGPPKARAEEIVALLESGVVRASLGPAPAFSLDSATDKIRAQSTMLQVPFTVSLDWMCLAFLDQPSLARTFSPLLESLVKNGRLREFNYGAVPGSIDLRTDMHPVNANGETERRLWVLGPLTEGVKYFNNYIPSPKSRIRAFQEADTCVLAILKGEEACGHQMNKTTVTEDMLQEGLVL